MPTWDNIHADNLEDFIIQVNQRLAWILSKLDSKNVKRLDTNETVIKSADGSTEIVGPLLVMKDKQSTPVLRLKMGYDAVTGDFVFQLSDKTGALTVSIDSNGKATFAGSLNAATGTFDGNVTAQDLIINNGAGTGSLNFSISGQYVTLKTSYTTSGNTLIVGKTTAIGQIPALMERIDLMAGWLYVYNNLYVATSISINGFLAATQDWVTANYQPKITGANGTFKTGDTPQKTVTVSNGIITSIV